MKKEEYIKKYGKTNYRIQVLQQSEDWRKSNQDKVKIQHQQQSRKGGKHYNRKRFYEMNGLPHARELIRKKHQYRWREYKQIIAPNSVLHHQWLLGTPDYIGVALVEKDQHQYGFIDVIQILEGEITLLTETEIANMGVML